MLGLSVFCAAPLLLVVGWVLRRAQGGWLAPGPFFALYWALGLAAPVILAPAYVVSPAAVLYVVVLVLAFCLGSFFGGGPTPPVRSGEVASRPLDVRLLRMLVAAGTAAGILATLIIQMVNGYSLTAILSLSALVDSVARFSVERYSGTVRTPGAVPLLLAFTYAAAMVAALAARGLSRRWAIACYVGPITGATTYSVMTSARFSMLCAAFFALAGWFAATLYAEGRTPLIRLRAGIGVFVVASIVGVLFVAIAFLRVGSFDARTAGLITAKLLVYAVGYLSTFSQWFDAYDGVFPSYWGGGTFAVIAEVTGAAGGRSAAYSEAVGVGPGLGTSTIYTAWRYLIEDFGIGFAPLAAASAGWLATSAWRAVIQRPTPHAFVGVLVSSAFLLNTNTQTLFLFTNVVVAVLIAWCVLARAQELGTSSAASTGSRSTVTAGSCAPAGARPQRLGGSPTARRTPTPTLRRTPRQRAPGRPTHFRTVDTRRFQ